MVKKEYGWTVLDKKLHRVARQYKKKNEIQHIVGPFTYNHRDYYLAAYWIGKNYWSWYLNGFRKIVEIIPGGLFSIHAVR